MTDDKSKQYAIIGLIIIIIILWFLRKGGVTILSGSPTIAVGGPIVSTYETAPLEPANLMPYLDKLGDIIMNPSFPKETYVFGSPPGEQRNYDWNFGPTNVPYIPGSTSNGGKSFDWTQTTDLICCCTDRDPVAYVGNEHYSFARGMITVPTQHYETATYG